MERLKQPFREPGDEEDGPLRYKIFAYLIAPSRQMDVSMNCCYEAPTTIGGYVDKTGLGMTFINSDDYAPSSSVKRRFTEAMKRLDLIPNVHNLPVNQGEPTAIARSLFPSNAEEAEQTKKGTPESSMQ